MLFSSIPFLYYFLPLFFAVYFAMPKKTRNAVLLLASLIFYFYGERGYVLLLVFSSVMDYTVSLLIEKHRGKPAAKAALLVSVIVNLLLLGFFKYSDFLIGSVNALFGLSVPLLHIHLPLGISFYTFQTMSYTIDVYRGDAKPQRNPLDFAAYVTMFPQLVAGPIVRYQTVAGELTGRGHTMEGFAAGATRFLIGLGKKVLIANAAGRTADLILTGNLAQITVLDAWIGMLCFTFQIYFDFSGYSDMAIGLGRVFGFRFGENFNYPYVSRSITEFWRRWHISLGSFFRDYVYIPLGGNRRFQLRNILIVWLLTGLWHGASWNFVLWGAYYGVLLSVEKFALKKWRLPGFSAVFATFFFTVLGWVLFYFTDLTRAGAAYAALFGVGRSFASQTSWTLLLNNAPLLILAFLAATPLPSNIAVHLKRLGLDILSPKRGAVRAAATSIAAAVLLALSTIMLVGDSYNPFLYFRF